MSSTNLDLLGSFFGEQDYLTKYPDARLVVASGAFPSLKSWKIILLLFGVLCIIIIILYNARCLLLLEFGFILLILS